MKKPIIYTKKAVVLQALQDAVCHGQSHYIAGSTPIEKIEQTVAIFDVEHHAFSDKNERARLRRKKFGQVKAVLWHPKDSDRVFWWLMATPPQQGKNHIHVSENLKDAYHPKQRLTVEDFELVRLPKKGSSVAKLTWRLTDEAYTVMGNRITDAVRSSSFHKMHRILLTLWNYPGMGGIRVQVGHLVARYKHEIKRANLKGAPTPPKKLYYLRRIAHDGLTPRQLLNQLKDRD